MWSRNFIKNDLGQSFLRNVGPVPAYRHGVQGVKARARARKRLEFRRTGNCLEFGHPVPIVALRLQGQQAHGDSLNPHAIGPIFWSYCQYLPFRYKVP